MQVDLVAGHSFLVEGLGPQALVVDLGLNRGAFALPIKRRFGCRVIGVEALAEVASQVPRDHGIEIEVAAIGGYDGTANVFDNRESCATTVRGLAEHDAASHEVAAVTLGSLFNRYGIDRIDLLKMDIEGAEIQTLTAASDQLLHRISQITIEFHDWLDPVLADDTKRIDQKLRNIGFRRISFSRTTTDVLYVNAAVIPLSRLAYLYLVLRYKYLRGITRIVRARLNAI